MPKLVKIEIKDQLLQETIDQESIDAKKYWGLSRSIADNMIQGVAKGFTSVVKIKGVGYKANVRGDFLTLNLGYSHEIKFEIPQSIKVKPIKADVIEVSSYDKEKLGLFCAKLKKYRIPDPYKGSGITINDEYVRRIEGKK